MTCVQIFPVGDLTSSDLKRFINRTAGIEPNIVQIEQASYDVRVGYIIFQTPEKAQSAKNKLNKSDLNGMRVHARVITPREDEYGICVGPKGYVQDGNYDSGDVSRYPGAQSSFPPSGSSKKHTNRRSYQQQQTDPRNFGGIITKFNDSNQLDNQPNSSYQQVPSYQQNSRFPQSSSNRPQYPEQGFDQRNVGMDNSENQYEKVPSQSKESKSRSSSSRHRRHRRDSSGSSSSSSSSESSDSSPRQSRHKHRHHHHHHHKSK